MYLLLGPIIVVSILTLPVIEPVTSVHPIAVLKPSGVPDDFGTGFGYSVAISGDFIAVGAPHAPWNNGDMIGAVHVYQRVGPHWVERTKLTGSDAQYMAQMGWSLDMDGDTIVAGAPVWEPASCEFRQQGAAYVFVRDSNDTPHDSGDDIWIEQAKLTAPLLEHGRGFGSSVAIKGHLIVVGSECGESAEVYRRNKGIWAHETTLVDNEPDPRHEFGTAVDTDGTRIVVGSFGYNERRGAAHVFFHCEDGWSLEQTLNNEDAQEWDDFARTVCISKDLFVAGAPHEDLNHPQSSLGAAYLFQNDASGWGEPEQFVASSISSVALFGWAGAISQDFVLVTPGTKTCGFLFEKGSTGWQESARLIEKQSFFSPSTSMDGQYAVISSQVYVVRDRKCLRDFAAFQNCLGSVPNEDSCARFDLDDTGPLDVDSFSRLLAGFGGP